MQITFLGFIASFVLQQSIMRSRHDKQPPKFPWWFEACWIHHAQQQKPLEVSFASRFKESLVRITLCSAAGWSSSPTDMGYMWEPSSSSSYCKTRWKERISTHGVLGWTHGLWTIPTSPKLMPGKEQTLLPWLWLPFLQAPIEKQATLCL